MKTRKNLRTVKAPARPFWLLNEWEEDHWKLRLESGTDGRSYIGYRFARRKGELLPHLFKEDLKLFCQFLMDRGGLYGAHLQPQTVLQYLGELKALFVYCISGNIHSPLDISTDDVEAYLKKVTSNRTKRRAITKRAIMRMGRAFSLANAFYRHTKGVDWIDSGKVNHFTKRYDKGSYETAGWKALSKTSACALLNCAATVLDNSDLILDYRDAALKRYPVAGSRKRPSSRLLASYKAIAFESRQLAAFPQETRLRPPEETNLDWCSHNLRMLLAAIVLIILFTVGLRISDVRCLRRDCLKAFTHSDGEELTYLVGPLKKSNDEPHRWVVSSLAERAITAALRLFEPYANQGNDDLLFKPISRYHFYDASYPVQGHSLESVNPLLRLFCEVHGFEDLASGPDRLHSHRGRKTFAKLVALRDKRGLEALATHLGHMDLAMSDTYYVGNDHELSDMIDDEVQQAIVDEISAAAVSITGRDKRIPGRMLTRDECNTLIKSRVNLTVCEWGFCAFDASLSKCGGETFPDYSRKVPENCANCMNLRFTRAHADYWQSFLRRSETLLAGLDAPPQTKLVLEHRVASARKVLDELDGGMHHDEC